MLWEDFSYLPLKFILILFIWFGIPFLAMLDLAFWHIIDWKIDAGIILSFCVVTFKAINEELWR